MMRGLLQEALGENKVRCNVCAFRCKLSDGQVGLCRTRRNDGGEIIYLGYDRMGWVCPKIDSCGAHSYCAGGGTGCNWSCSFCISAESTNPEFVNAQRGSMHLPLTRDGFLDKKSLRGRVLPMFPTDRGEQHPQKLPAEVVEDWKASGKPWFAIRTTEPSVHVEAVSEILSGVKQAGGFTMINTNGYWTSELVPILAPLVDLVDVGLKGSANARFLQKIAGVPRSEPIFETIEALVDQGCQVLVSDIPIPHAGFEEDFRGMCSFIERTIPARDWPRLKIYPWWGTIPEKAFGEFSVGWGEQVPLLVRAAEIALEQIEAVWITPLTVLKGTLDRYELLRALEESYQVQVNGEAARISRMQVPLKAA